MNDFSVHPVSKIHHCLINSLSFAMLLLEQGISGEDEIM